MNPEIEELIKFRLIEANSSLKEAQVLAEKSLFRGAINRSYYAMFYATLALLATRNLGASKHSGVIALFNKEFVKDGPFPKDLAGALVTAFDVRNKTDYRDFVEAGADQANQLITNATTFIQAVEDIIAPTRPAHP